MSCEDKLEHNRSSKLVKSRYGNFFRGYLFYSYVYGHKALECMNYGTKKFKNTIKFLR